MCVRAWLLQCGCGRVMDHFFFPKTKLRCLIKCKGGHKYIYQCKCVRFFCFRLVLIVLVVVVLLWLLEHKIRRFFLILRNNEEEVYYILA